METRKLKALSTAAALTIGVLSAPSLAAVDMFIKIGDIKGESQDAKHKGEIDVLAWSWGLSQSSTGASRRRSGVCVQDVSLTKFIDTASTDLIMGATIGKVYDSATITVRSAGEVPLEYLIINMRDVSLSSYSTGGSGGEDRLTENVSLNFSEAEWNYTEQTRDGGGGATTTAVISGSAGSCR